MFTYRKELERKGWHRPLPVRVVLVVLALFVGLYGWFEWTMEQDKGGWGDLDIGMVEEGEFGDRAFVWNEAGDEVIFEGTSIEEVDAWIESQRDRDFTMPMLLLAGSAVLLVVGAAPSPRRPEPRNAPPPVDVGT